MIAPAVANDTARLRFFISSEHSDEQLRWAARATAEGLALVSTALDEVSLVLTP
jgi:hypothetical protein